MRFAAVAVALLALASPARSAGVGLGEAFPTVCAAGFHRDRGGNCQPDGGETNRYCPPGLVFHPEFDGWSCNPPPPEAY